METSFSAVETLQGPPWIDSTGRAARRESRRGAVTIEFPNSVLLPDLTAQRVPAGRVPSLLFIIWCCLWPLLNVAIYG